MDQCAVDVETVGGDVIGAFQEGILGFPLRLDQLASGLCCRRLPCKEGEDQPDIACSLRMSAAIKCRL